jgi:NAD(P)-dependent dehydrogenase (short-subunit alcohol dehydrogenase family)
MGDRFAGRTALVTGAAGGIGRAVVRALLDEGAGVVALDCSRTGLAALQGEVGAVGGRYTARVGDVTRAGDVAEAVAWVDRLDLLVTCAGYYTAGPTEQLAREEWQRALDINLKGTFLCCQAAARRMLPHRAGAIVTLSSSVGAAGLAEHAAYAASKAGITGFAKSLARELGTAGIRVNCVVPGAVDSPLHRQMVEQGYDAPGSLVDNPLHRAGTAADVAQLVLFLLSDATAHLTGQVVHCNAGGLMP